MILPALDPSGARTGRQASLFSTLLVLASIVPAVVRISGGIYLAGALILGVPALTYAFSFARLRDSASARRLFLFSLTYLPLVFLLLAIDRIFS